MIWYHDGTWQRCADMYPRIDILRIFAILTDTDRIRIVISLLERIRILCHGYSTDMHYALMLFCLKIILCVVYIRRHTGHRHKMQLQVIELSNTQYRVIDASLRQIRAVELKNRWTWLDYTGWTKIPAPHGSAVLSAEICIRHDGQLHDVSFDSTCMYNFDNVVQATEHCG